MQILFAKKGRNGNIYACLVLLNCFRFHSTSILLIVENDSSSAFKRCDRYCTGKHLKEIKLKKIEILSFFQKKKKITSAVLIILIAGFRCLRIQVDTGLCTVRTFLTYLKFVCLFAFS